MARKYGQVARSVADDKTAHPERYCKVTGCLWKTAMVNHKRDGYVLNSNPCPKHKAAAIAEDTFSRIERSVAARDAFDRTFGE